MEPMASEPLVREIMDEFARDTGLSGEKPPQRYLWTDALALGNYLGLYRRTGEDSWRQLALSLIDQVHQVLGRHREDDPRSGWLSGLDEEEGQRHPTRGGLRIGKKMNERRSGEPLDERLEWERDGQYFHYLTKWMHALQGAGRATGQPRFHLWARELAKTAHAAFTYPPPTGSRKKMYWKMSIDLSLPLVSSMGQHDPLDGLITFLQLQATAPPSRPEPDLGPEIAELAEICRGTNWATDDPLGTGGLLFDACRLGQLAIRGEEIEGKLLADVLDAALIGLEAFATRNPFRLPAAYRPAFRELGLSIGLKAGARLQQLLEENRSLYGRDVAMQRRLDGLLRHLPQAGKIEAFWAEGENRESDGWREHREINMVMLATSLAPEEFLTI